MKTTGTCRFLPTGSPTHSRRFPTRVKFGQPWQQLQHLKALARVLDEKRVCTQVSARHRDIMAESRQRESADAERGSWYGPSPASNPSPEWLRWSAWSWVAGIGGGHTTIATLKCAIPAQASPRTGRSSHASSHRICTARLNRVEPPAASRVRPLFPPRGLRPGLARARLRRSPRWL